MYFWKKELSLWVKGNVSVVWRLFISGLMIGQGYEKQS